MILKYLQLGYLETINVTADVESNQYRFGTFTMRYDLRNKEANVAAGFPQCKHSPIIKGYLSVDGSTTIEYREEGWNARTKTELLSQI